jgi:hypothetical protein
MSRTFPRAKGFNPAKCVSRKTSIAGLDATENFPLKVESILAQCNAKSNEVAVDFSAKLF